MNGLHVLLIEDNDVDAERVQRLFRRSRVQHELMHVENAQAGLDVLDGPFTPDKALPDIILLDLNLPGLNGLEFLEILRNSEHTASLPVCILSSSNWHSDVDRATALGITKYFVKPISGKDIDQLSTLLGRPDSFALPAKMTRRAPSG